MEEVERQCRAAGVKAVSRKAIDLRIGALDPRLVASRRHGGKAARTAFGPVGGHYDVSTPLDVMQIDHRDPSRPGYLRRRARLRYHPSIMMYPRKS
jgi:hypothetical protein